MDKSILPLIGIILSILTTSCHVEIEHKHGDEEDGGSNFEYRDGDEDSEPDIQFQYNPALKQFSPSISP